MAVARNISVVVSKVYTQVTHFIYSRYAYEYLRLTYNEDSGGVSGVIFKEHTLINGDEFKLGLSRYGVLGQYNINTVWAVNYEIYNEASEKLDGEDREFWLAKVGMRYKF